MCPVPLKVVLALIICGLHRCPLVRNCKIREHQLKLKGSILSMVTDWKRDNSFDRLKGSTRSIDKRWKDPPGLCASVPVNSVGERGLKP